MQDWLKVYANVGWQVFPCSNKDKAPITKHGFKDATCDWRQIQEWHRQNPGCAWGVATSAERGVIDVDPRHGGNETLAALIAEHGALPDTPRVRTGSHGYHYWFRFPAGTPCGKPFPGIDRKAEGGYVIVPPSKIEIPEHEGRSYLWELRPWEVAIAEAPAWLLTAKPKAKASADADTQADPWIVRESNLDLLTHQGSPEGERRKTLIRIAGVHLARGDSESTVYTLAEAWASKCTPPFDDWQKHVDGLVRKERAKGLRMTTSSSLSPIQAGSLSPEAGREGTNSSEPDRQPEAEGVSDGLGQANQAGSSQASAIGSVELVSSLPPRVHGEEHGGESESGLSSSFPTLPPEAYHGLLGDMLRAVEPETEADPSGVLLGWLSCFGNIVGRGAWVQVGPRLHHPALYVGIVGRTSDAKGDGWAVSLYPFKQVERAWAGSCIDNGVGSGEGLIERVADAQNVLDKDGNVKVIPGALDKRCLLRLSELSKCFKLGRRENATLSEYLREGWDGEPISIPNRKGNALGTSDYAISMVGDITPGMVRRLMDGGTEAFDGWANRYLWACVRSPRSLPMGGNIAVLKPYLERLASALAFAKSVGEVKMQAEAVALWKTVYPSLKASGDSVPHTDRARPYALRLAMLYALADGSSVIRLDHLQAALALWSYCRASAKLIFGSQQTAEAKPEPLWLRLLNVITASPGVNRTGFRETVGTRITAQAIEEALASLEANRLAFRRMVQPVGGGRPAECWFPGPKPDGGSDAESQEDDDFSSLSQTNKAFESSGRKQTNSEADASAELVSFPFGREGNSPEAQAGVSLFPSRVPAEKTHDTGEVVKQSPPATSPKPSAPSHVAIADITPPPNAPLEAEADDDDEALGDDDFLGDFIKAKRKAKEDEEWDATWTG